MIIHILWNTSPSFCNPITKVKTKIKQETLTEIKVISNLNLVGFRIEVAFGTYKKGPLPISTNSFVPSKVQGCVLEPNSI